MATIETKLLNTRWYPQIFTDKSRLFILHCTGNTILQRIRAIWWTGMWTR